MAQEFHVALHFHKQLIHTGI